MDSEARIILEDVIAFCRRDDRDRRLINMLEQCVAGDYDETSLTIRVPSKFAQAFLLKQQDIIERYLEDITFIPTRFNVALDDGGAGARHEETGAGSAAAGHTDPAGTVAGTGLDGAEAGGGTAVTASAVGTPAAPLAAAAGSTPAGGAAVDSATGINVVNTMSVDAFRKMVASMGGAGAADKPATPSDTAAGSAPQAPRADGGQSSKEPYPSVDINAKFTFESFVFGDENKHAYQSSLRFAAFADEPGQCTSLFIYGNSGLGKTHLLFAIKNYLAAEKPHLRVKYANSQAYFEDYLHDLSLQKGPGEPIMREYHAADILIIDDIQNILGKQATIEYFFQLVDEFIRSGKKIVIASDRAPKDLNLDERLTSRFNHGMLCLVSEPGFEMKYTILKRYYETILCRKPDLSGLNVDDSLLSVLQDTEGKLTDEQLRHMAEISGNNIRNLESFCERCASRSAEREAEGRELDAEDIDGIAEQYFNTAHKIIHVNTVQKVVEEYYRVSHEDIIGPRRTANIAWARHVAVYLANSLCEMTTPAIGAEFGGRDHSTVLNSLKVVENKMKENRQIFEDIQTLKNKIILKS